MASVIDSVVNLAKRRGLVYQSGEIYRRHQSAWDYGPLGVELKENIKRQWWKSVVTGRDDVVGLDSSIILPREVRVASGHVEVFNDPLVECLNCHKRHRQTTCGGLTWKKKGAKAGLSGSGVGADGRHHLPGLRHQGQWTEPRDFNMMLKTYLRPDRDRGGSALSAPGDGAGHLRQLRQRGHHVAQKPPFGIGQIGKSFRNEITRATSSSAPASSSRWRWSSSSNRHRPRVASQYWIDTRLRGMSTWASTRRTCGSTRHPKEKLSHYSDRTVDIEYKFGFQGNPG